MDDNNELVQWLWSILEEFSNSERVLFMRFVSGRWAPLGRNLITYVCQSQLFLFWTSKTAPPTNNDLVVWICMFNLVKKYDELPEYRVSTTIPNICIKLPHPTYMTPTDQPLLEFYSSWNLPPHLPHTTNVHVCYLISLWNYVIRVSREDILQGHFRVKVVPLLFIKKVTCLMWFFKK